MLTAERADAIDGGCMDDERTTGAGVAHLTLRTHFTYKIGMYATYMGISNSPNSSLGTNFA